MTKPANDRLIAFTLISSAAFAGGNLFIGLSIGGYWISLSPVDYMAVFFGQWLFFLLTIMPLLLMTLYGLIKSAKYDADTPAIASYWRPAILCLIATCLITILFHMPLNLRLGAATFTPEQAANSALYGVLSIFGRVTPENADFTRTLWLIGHVPRIILAIAIPYLVIGAALKRHDMAASGPRVTQQG